MSKPLRFDRLARKLLKGGTTPGAGELVANVGPDQPPRIDVAGLRREIQRYDYDVQERLRLAALRAIDEELAKIQAERKARDDER